MSADIEVVRPSFSSGLPVGVDSPEIAGQGAVRAGAVFQYVEDPLVLYAWGTYSGAVIQHRLVSQLGVSWDARDDLSFRVVAPLVAQWGTEVPDLAAEMAGMGDLTAGFRWRASRHERLQLGTRADVSMPVGLANAWIGEPMPRLHLGGLAAYQLGAAQLIGDAGLTLRAPVDTDTDLVLGQELVLNAGASAPIVGDRLQASLSALSRLGLTRWHGSAELPLELTGALHAQLGDGWRLDVGLGKGVGYGYGTSSLRAITALTWTQAPADEELIVHLARVEEAAPPPIPEELEEEEPAPDAWGDGQRARLKADRIELRHPIRFELGTPVLLEESIPTLQAVADILSEDGTIGEVLIEGHASDEGTFEYNYDLSMRRAAAIFRTLVDMGVHPKRVSVRGMGEVEPTEEGQEASRRVEFHVIRWLQGGEERYPEVSAVRLPWTGEDHLVTWPKPPPRGPESLMAMGALAEWAPRMGEEWACGEDVRDQIAEAEDTVKGGEDYDDTELSALLARAESAMSCAPRVGGELLGRYWLAASAVAARQGDLDRATLALVAGQRAAPDLSLEGWPPALRALAETLGERPAELGWLTIQTPPDWWVAVDGLLVDDTRALPTGLHLVQAGQGSRAGFARIVDVARARETVVAASTEVTTGAIHLGATAHDPWATALVASPSRPRPGITADVPWPKAPQEVPALFAEVSPQPWTPFADPSAVFVRPEPVTPLQAFVRGLDSRDLTMASSVAGSAALGLGMAALAAQTSFNHAESWPAARNYSRLNHASVVGSGTLGVAAAGLMTWAVIEGRW
ncbi:MAG: OmpA family protein [Deltaproteobacteria bacterium]|nr:OmpA family protein [Deltaproteobacteria bacterium]